jgi:predicted RNase H-like HicB family nuclease
MAESNKLEMLCRVWAEDGVWNASVEGLPIAVAGETFEDALQNLRDAIRSHMESAAELGMMPSVLATLDKEKNRTISARDIPANAAMLKLVFSSPLETVAH